MMDADLTDHVQACDNINIKCDCFHKTDEDGIKHYLCKIGIFR